MANGDATTIHPAPESRLPLVLVGVVVAAVLASNLFADAAIGLVALGALAGAAVMATRPAYAVILMLGSFLVTYPWWLQGRGFLTLNNVLGAWLAAVMAYRVFRSGDLSILRNREFQLLVAISVVFLVSRFLHRPDAHTMELVAPLVVGDQDPARIIVNRLLFFLFLIYFIRTPQQVRAVFLLAVSLMVLSGFAAIWWVLSGYGFGGYRARSGLFLAAAGNPNRLALAATIGIIALWYFMQWQRRTVVTVLVSGVIAVEVLAVFMAGSRSGVTGLLLATLILFLEGGLSPQKIVMAALATLVAAMLVVRAAPEESLERISSLPGTEAGASGVGAGSVERRGYTAALAVEIAQQNPLIGVGIGNWEISRYLADPVHNITPPHSAVLMALAEGGIITLLLYVVLLTRTLRHFLDSATALQAAGHGGWMLWMAKSLRASFIVFLAMSLVGDLWLNILFYWFVGLGATLSRVIFEPETVTGEEVEPSMAEAAA